MSLLNKVKTLKEQGSIIKGAVIDPKNEEKAKLFGPFSVVTYFNNKSVDMLQPKEIEVDIEIENEVETEFSNPNWNTKDLKLEELVELTRANYKSLGIKRATMWQFKDTYNIFIEVLLETGETFYPIVFPVKESNAGIYRNTKGECSFVIDGQVTLHNGELFLTGANQRVVDAFVESQLSKDPKRFKDILNSEIWGIEEEKEEKEEKEKSILFLEKVTYMNFPQFNVAWLEKGNIVEFTKSGEINIEQLRVTSLSQTGKAFSIGPVLNRTNMGYRIGNVNKFDGDKGKFDISATFGPKSGFKTKHIKEKCLVVLAELTSPGATLADNLMGNILASESAGKNFLTSLSYDLWRKRGLKELPSIKAFIGNGKEAVRIKGATRFYFDKDLKAVVNGVVEHKVVVLPPREINPKGVIETDIGKFEYLCHFSDVVEVELEFYGKKYTVPGLYQDVYEDAHHSAVYSLEVKPRNNFYYGPFKLMVQQNGFEKVATAISQMLDHNMLAQALNVAEISKLGIEEIGLDEFIKSL